MERNHAPEDWVVLQTLGPRLATVKRESVHKGMNRSCERSPRTGVYTISVNAWDTPKPGGLAVRPAFRHFSLGRDLRSDPLPDTLV